MTKLAKFIANKKKKKEKEKEQLKILITISVLFTLFMLVACGENSVPDRASLKAETGFSYTNNEVSKAFETVVNNSCLKTKDTSTNSYFEVGCENIRKYNLACHYWGSYSSCDLSVIEDKDNIEYKSKQVIFQCFSREKPMSIYTWNSWVSKGLCKLTPMV